MHWYVIILIILGYMMVGGAVTTIVEKIGTDVLWFLYDIPPIVIILLWPILAVVGIIALVTLGAAAFGGFLVEECIKYFKKEDGQDTSK